MSGYPSLSQMLKFLSRNIPENLDHIFTPNFTSLMREMLEFPLNSPEESEAEAESEAEPIPESEEISKFELTDLFDGFPADLLKNLPGGAGKFMNGIIDNHNITNTLKYIKKLDEQSIEEDSSEYDTEKDEYQEITNGNYEAAITNKNIIEPILNLFTLIQHGEFDEAIKIIKDNPESINWKIQSNVSLMHAACTYNSLDLVQLLTSLGMDATKYEDKYIILPHFVNSASPFDIACRLGFTDIVKYVLDTCDVETFGGDNALKYAIEGDHRDVIDILLNHVKEGQDVNDIALSNGLHYSCEYDKIESARLLLEKGAKKIYYDERVDYYADSFSIASAKGHIDIIDLLLENVTEEDMRDNAAVYSACKKGQLETLKYLINHGFEMTDYDEILPIEAAAKNNHLDCIKYLVEHGANLNESPDIFDYAIKNDGLEIVKYLIEHGLDPNIGAIDTACDENNTEIAIYLLDHGADPNIIRPKGNPALFYAIINENYELATELIERGAEINVKMHSPYSYAARLGQIKMIDFLYQNGRELGEDGDYALIIAAFFGYIDIFKNLIEMNVDFRKNEGELLSNAASEGKYELLEYMLKLGMNPNALNFKGRTALYGAYISLNYESAKLLLEYGADMNITLENDDFLFDYISDDNKIRLNWLRLLYGDPISETIFEQMPTSISNLLAVFRDPYDNVDMKNIFSERYINYLVENGML